MSAQSSPAWLHLPVNGRPDVAWFVQVVAEDGADLRRVAHALDVQPVDYQPAAESAPTEAREHPPHGLGVTRIGQARHRQVEGEEPVRVLGVVEDDRVADALDGVAAESTARA